MRTFNIGNRAAKSNNRRNLILAGGALILGLLTAGTQAKADRVHFRYTGGRWSHNYRAGWHRYWGGPSIGFYYAPSPVYLVPGYAEPSYYTGPDFWYSNPSFGLSLNFGGGGGYYGGGGGYYGGYRGVRGDRYNHGGDRYYRGGDRYNQGGGRSYGGRGTGDRHRR